METTASNMLNTSVSSVKSQSQVKSKKFVFIGENGYYVSDVLLEKGGHCVWFRNSMDAYLWLKYNTISQADFPEVIFCDVQLPDGNAYSLFKSIKEYDHLNPIPFIILSTSGTKMEKIKALEAGVDDFYTTSVNAKDIINRAQFLAKFKREKENLKPTAEIRIPKAIKIPVAKRLFDIAVSSMALLFLLPFFIVIAILIKLESKGSVFYISKRAGTGYKIFNFYKFRSMRQGADDELKKLMHLNQYGKGASPFVKIDNDPRVTKLGKFLRKTSIDELPQFINVLIGDMSIVGNRPLPLYEAEQLTTDEWATRFMAPAGITGLWQVTKRGRKEMSEAERKALDIEYAKNNSLWYDCKIILKTIPALLQKEAV